MLTEGMYIQCITPQLYPCHACKNSKMNIQLRPILVITLLESIKLILIIILTAVNILPEHCHISILLLDSAAKQSSFNP